MSTLVGYYECIKDAQYIQGILQYMWGYHGDIMWGVPWSCWVYQVI